MNTFSLFFSVVMILSAASAGASEVATKNIIGISERDGSPCLVRKGDLIRFQEVTPEGDSWVNSLHCVVTVSDK